MHTSRITIGGSNYCEITIREETTTESFSIEFDPNLINQEKERQHKSQGQEEGSDDSIRGYVTATTEDYIEHSPHDRGRDYLDCDEVASEFNKFVEAKKDSIFNGATSEMGNEDIFLRLRSNIKNLNNEVFMPKLWQIAQSKKTSKIGCLKGFEIRPVFYLHVCFGDEKRGVLSLYYKAEDGIILGNNWGREHQGFYQEVTPSPHRA